MATPRLPTHRARLLRGLTTLLLSQALIACQPEGENGAGDANATPGRATLTIDPTPQQTFAGFGFSFTDDDPYLTLDPAARSEADRLLFTELGTRIVRLWHEPGNPERTLRTYRDGGVVAGALTHGVTELLLAPEGYTPGDPEGYAETLTNDILTLRQGGIPITVTGTQNEPGSGERADIPDEDLLPLYRAMRAKLDAKGLKDVKLLGPEYASNDDGPKDFVAAIQADPIANAAYQGVAHHSYNMAGDPKLATLTRAAGKQYWQTEAGGGSQDGSAEFDYDFAAEGSARLLNDLNNGVTHWLWFIGLGQGDRDVLQKLVMLGPNGFYKNFTYHHMQQITTRFPPGTVLRHVTSDLPDARDLVWTYGVKPPLHAAAGLRPDGRYAIGVLNRTKGSGKGGGFGYQAAQPYEVAIEASELAAAPVEFELCRTGRAGPLRCDERLTMTAGKATVTLTPAELVTLVSLAPVRPGS